MSSELHAPAGLPCGKVLGAHWMGGWVGFGTGLDVQTNQQVDLAVTADAQEHIDSRRLIKHREWTTNSILAPKAG
jgi:hypothetical protein